MDSLETNKAIAAVLLAGIAFSGAGLLSSALVRPHELKESVLRFEAPRGTAAVATAEPDPPLPVLLASADVARGEGLVKSQGCVACHSFNQGGKAGIGPNLYGVLGAPHGHQEGFAYSAALKAKQGPWTYEEMNEWLKKPAAYAPGTKMSYAGLADPKKRADIIDYLRSLSDKPLPLPAVPAAASAAAAPVAAAAATPGPGAPAPAPGGETSLAARLASADPKAGQAETMKLGCIACHSYNEGGKAGIGPNVWGVVGAPIGSHMQGYTYSNALKAKGGDWTYENLDAWLTKPAAFAPGTKMTYLGVSDPQTRANLIAYLRTLSSDPVPLPAP